ncbi:3-hydroxyacyl-CoA dehydrogenase NAD-binding domain-containing protein [Acinetobacter colistiniresistens]|uniref:3-hydroxyacyl-CoA dehydrogenase NAD-binding domain-containing protein n=1 Tax=Acinetobacter colistiniresistens TaxID=280145 RepID=UPI000DD0C7F7|nr:3-hydroxyacyl-CoA dehydrogenase NAD-binding domain-containing protein [Acinetobacter colistiniresistens]
MSTIKQVAVLGAGRMGKAIAIAFAYAGLKVQYGAGNNPGTDFVENRIMTTYTHKF